MLHVHRSHRTEDLAEVLAGLLAQPLDDPMATERVLVGSPGMVRWLEGELARRSPHGVHAGVDAEYPGRFVQRLVDDVLGESGPDTDPWSKRLLPWTVAEVLPDLLEDPPTGDADPFVDVRRYLRDTTARDPVTTDRRLLGLAGQVAARFDRYALHRPGMLEHWHAGRDLDADGAPLGRHAWQAMLWRAVRDHLRGAPPTDRVEAARRHLLEGGRVPEHVPARLAVFGVSTLPPLHLGVLAAVARDRDVHLLVPSPTPASWARGWARSSEPAAAPLLRAAGPTAADAARLVHDAADAAVVQVTDHGPSPASDPAAALAGTQRVLARLQATLVHDVDPRGLEPVAADATVALHDCHGPLRQVEVLRDELRRRLDADPTLQPRDVVVLTPDVATYGPLVESVLAAAPLEPDGPPALPVAVADRAVGRGNEVATVLLRAVDLVEGRASAPQVLDLLTSAPVLRAFGIDAGDVATLERWVTDVGVRWGRDEADRAAAGQPADRHHTWAGGLDRLLVGVALADEGARTLGGVVPYDHVEDGADLALLDRLASFLAAVDDLRDLRAPSGPTEWGPRLREVLDRLTGPADGRPGDDPAVRARHRRERERVDAALSELDLLGEFTGRPLEVAALQRWLVAALDEAGGAAGYATGRITLAGLVPLRAVPYRVVCLLGFDEGTFPRRAGRQADDLLAADRRPGDPDPRAEDRHALLEALLAARDGLVVLWSGRDQRRGEERPPAVPVAELRDALDHLVVGGAAAVTSVHPVLPTSPRAFAGAGSYDADRARAATAVPAGRAEPFVPSPLPDEREDPATVELHELVRVARHPARALLRSTLRVAASEEVEQRSDVEPLELSARERSRAGGRLLEQVRGGEVELDAHVAALLRSGTVPAGTPGALELDDVVALVDRFARAERHLGAPRPHEVDLDLGRHGLVGTVPAVQRDDGLLVVDVRYSKLRAKDRVAAWLRHLALAAATPDTAVRTLLLRRGRDDGTEVAGLARRTPGEAAALLRPWLEQHDEALASVVAFLPDVSWAYADRRCDAIRKAATKGADAAALEGLGHDALADALRPHGFGKQDPLPVLERGLAEARRAFRDDGGRGFPAWDDPDVRLVFRDTPRFEELVARTDLLERAVRLLAPLAEALADGREHAEALAEEAAP